MPTLWETITSNSAAQERSTLWTHLNSQEGGGEVVYVLPRDSFGVSTNKVLLEAPLYLAQLEVTTKVVSTAFDITNTQVIVGVSTNVV